MLARKDIMVFVAKLLRSVQGKYRKHTVLSERSLYHSIKELTKQQFVFFSKGDDIASLNKVMMYLHENETTNKIRDSFCFERISKAHRTIFDRF